MISGNKKSRPGFPEQLLNMRTSVLMYETASYAALRFFAAFLRATGRAGFLRTAADLRAAVFFFFAFGAHHYRCGRLDVLDA